MKLNKSIREAIIENAVKKSSIPAQRDAHQNALYDLADKALSIARGDGLTDADFEAAEEESQAIKDRFPEAFVYDRALFDVTAFIRAKIGSEYERLYFRGDTKKHVPIHWTTFDANSEVALEWNALRNQKDDIDAQEETLRQSVRAAVFSVTMVEKLLEVWPESKELIPSDLGKHVGKMLPSVNVQSLNSLIGLPSE